MLTKCPSCEKIISVSKKGEQLCPKCKSMIYIGDPLKDEKNRKIKVKVSLNENKKKRGSGFSSDDKDKGEPKDKQSDELLSHIKKIQHKIAKDRSKGGVPWDNIANIGFVDALFETARELVLRPVSFFKNMINIKGYKFIPLFGIIFAVTGSLFRTFWSLYILKNYMQYIEPMLPAGIVDKIRMPETGDIVVQIMFTPVVMIMLSSFILFGLTILFGSKTKIHHYYRLMGFISVVDILYIIPFAGNIAVFIWQSILIIKGVSVINNFSIGRSFMLFLIYVSISSLLLLPLFSGV